MPNLFHGLWNLFVHGFVWKVRQRNNNSLNLISKQKKRAKSYLRCLMRASQASFLEFFDPAYVEKTSPGKKGHPPSTANLSERLCEKNVHPFRMLCRIIFRGRSLEWPKATSFLGGSGACPPGKYLKWICAEMQSDHFETQIWEMLQWSFILE